MLPIKTVILKTFKLVFKKEYVGKFAIIGIFVSVITFLTNLSFNYLLTLPVNEIGLFLTIISLLISVFIYIYIFSFVLSFIYNFCLAVSIESFQSINKYINLAYKTSFNVLGSIIIFGLIVFGGMILLIIPSIIWGVKYFFTPMISALEGKKAKEALKESKLLVKGHFWQILLRLIVFYFISSFPGIIISSINTDLSFIQPFFLPITSLFYVVLFNNLKYKYNNIFDNQKNLNPL